MKHFGFKKNLVMRGEHAFYFGLSKAVPELQQTTRALDTSLFKTQIGKRKRITDPRPDYYHYMREYDENSDHEDCDERLKIIHNSTDAGSVRTYVIRVQGHHSSKEKAVCKRYVINKVYTYYKLTEEGEAVVQRVAEAVRERLQWISEGLAHDARNGRAQKLYI